jgi:hypothetical protein
LLKPVPQGEARPSSMPSPLLPDPQDRRASNETYPTVQTTFVAAQNTVQDEDGWRPARD